jgi:PAS domain S-box-containing protein
MRADDDRLVTCALDSLDDVFYVYDAGGRLVHWNRALGEVFDLSDDELAGMRPTDFFVANDQPKIENAVARAIETGSAVVEARPDTPAGTIMFELTGRRLTDEDGQIVGLAGIGRDVTERREREWQLQRQNERLSEFSDVLTHDLRNPLQVAISYLELERVERDTDRLAEVSGVLERIEEIIDDVLLVAREGRAVIEREPVDVAEVARSAWQRMETEGARLETETTRQVEGDAERLVRLFENVYRNALEHGSTSNPPGADDAIEHGGEVRVRVVDIDGGFAIEDDGPGFPTANREELFDPGVSNASEGTGFGLNIVRTLAEAHGWTVSATDATDGGARLEFEFDVVSSGAAGLDATERREPDDRG